MESRKDTSNHDLRYLVKHFKTKFEAIITKDVEGDRFQVQTCVVTDSGLRQS